MSRNKLSDSLPLLCALCSTVAYYAPVTAQDAMSPTEARAIAKEAYIYGFPMVDGYPYGQKTRID